MEKTNSHPRVGCGGVYCNTRTWEAKAGDIGSSRQTIAESYLRKQGAGDLAQLLRACTALAEDPRLVPETN